MLKLRLRAETLSSLRGRVLTSRVSPPEPKAIESHRQEKCPAGTLNPQPCNFAEGLVTKETLGMARDGSFPTSKVEKQAGYSGAHL